MSINEIKGELDRMSASQRAQIQGHLRILRWKETPHLTDSLGVAHRKMDAGEVVSADQVESHIARLRQTNKQTNQ